MVHDKHSEEFVRNMKSFTAVIEITCVIISVADLTLAQNTDCPWACAANYQPVCGSDEKTYSNECKLIVEVRCRDPALYKVHDGPCSSDDYTASYSDCPRFCAQNYQPVCGSDENTYGNECELLSEVACNDPTLYKVHDGPCSSDSYSDLYSDPVTCDTYPCQNGGSCIDYGAFFLCRCPPGYNGVNCENELDSACWDCRLVRVDCYAQTPDETCGSCPSDTHACCENCCGGYTCVEREPGRCPFACEEIYHPVCGSDGKTYANDCELTSQSECYDDSLYKVFDGECSKSFEPVTRPTNQEDLWCPQKYPDDTNASLAQECSRNEDCVPGFGCCWLEDCPNGQCCVELVKEPADCLDGDDSFYGKDLSLRHGEGQQVGDPTCPASCFCENGRIMCALPQCLPPPGNEFSTLCRFLLPSLVIIAAIAVLCIVKMARARHRCVGNATPKATGSEVDKPPVYGEVVEVKYPSPSVATIDGKTPPSYEQAVKMA